MLLYYGFVLYIMDLMICNFFRRLYCVGSVILWPFLLEFLGLNPDVLILQIQSVAQVRDGLPKVHGQQQVEAGSQGPTAEGALGQLQGILN